MPHHAGVFFSHRARPGKVPAESAIPERVQPPWLQPSVVSTEPPIQTHGEDTMRWTTVAIFAFLITLPLAVPAQPSAAPDVDDGPWLPSAEQKALRKLWPKSVPFPAQLRFYKIAPAGQHLVILNGLDYRGVHAADYDFPSVNPNRIFPWQHSGGMHAVDANIWRNATAVALPPGGEVEYWLELTDAGAVRPLPRLTWAFPDGTLFADMLLLTTAAGERCFELGTRRQV